MRYGSRRGEVEVPEARPVGRVAWASPPPDLGAHTFNPEGYESRAKRVEGATGDVRIMELQPTAYSRGANNHVGNEMYRATQRAKGLEEEED